VLRTEKVIELIAVFFGLALALVRSYNQCTQVGDRVPPRPSTLLSPGFWLLAPRDEQALILAADIILLEAPVKGAPA
jgi:hypothetical protein